MKNIVLFVSSFIVLGMTSCGGTSDEAPTAQTPTTQARDGSADPKAQTFDQIWDIKHEIQKTHPRLASEMEKIDKDALKAASLKNCDQSDFDKLLAEVTCFQGLIHSKDPGMDTYDYVEFAMRKCPLAERVGLSFACTNGVREYSAP